MTLHGSTELGIKFGDIRILSKDGEPVKLIASYSVLLIYANDVLSSLGEVDRRCYIGK